MNAISIKSLADAQKVLQQLQNWQNQFNTTPLNYNGLRITNAGDAINPQDYVTLNQLQKQLTAPTSPNQHYAIVWDIQGVANNGDNSPPYAVLPGREGVPTYAWVASTVPPPSGDFTVNILYEGTQMTAGANILTTPLDLPQGSTSVIQSSQFILPTPTLGTWTKLWINVVNAGGASLVAVGLVVKRITSATT